jgi:hypothetical protein
MSAKDQLRVATYKCPIIDYGIFRLYRPEADNAASHTHNDPFQLLVNAPADGARIFVGHRWKQSQQVVKNYQDVLPGFRLGKGKPEFERTRYLAAHVFHEKRIGVLVKLYPGDRLA